MDRENKSKQVGRNVPGRIHTSKVLRIDKKHKNRRKKETKSNLPDGIKVIHPAHENFNMVFNIMLGIKKSVDSTLDIPMI